MKYEGRASKPLGNESGGWCPFEFLTGILGEDNLDNLEKVGRREQAEVKRAGPARRSQGAVGLSFPT